MISEHSEVKLYPKSSVLVWRVIRLASVLLKEVAVEAATTLMAYLHFFYTLVTKMCVVTCKALVLLEILVLNLHPDRGRRIDRSVPGVYWATL